MTPGTSRSNSNRSAGCGAIVVRSLGSGSSGNALLIAVGETALLVDCGLRPPVLAAALRAAGTSFGRLTALLLSHEHADHARALPTVTRHGVPVVATAGTARAAGVDSALAEVVGFGRSASIAGIEITPLAVSHDAAEPCGFSIRTPTARITVVTDLGCARPELAEAIGDSDLVVLEANHDEGLLRSGPYPPHLKRRVLSRRGHLSNADCGALLAEGLAGRPNPPTIWLAHLSQTNNRPALALRTVEDRLLNAGISANLVALPRHGAPVVWRSDAVGPPARQLRLAWP